jgi:RNA-directed DNA polymerase
MVIEPVFEREFAAHSYGFRPGRGSKDALRELDRLLRAGYTHVVDADLKAYFDSIPHHLLLAEISRYIADGRVLSLIEAFLKQDVLEDLTLWTPERGSLQGAVIGPLLADLYLHSVDAAMAAAGFEMIRYADDLVVMCRTERSANEALALVQNLAAALGLALHPVKTRLVDVSTPGEGFDFLGYRFVNGTRRPRHKSLNKLKDAVRSRTGRSNGHSMGVIIADLNGALRGWFEYFKHSNRWTFPPIDGWVRRRLRSILRQRMGLKGISRGLDHRRWPDRFFRDNGLFSLVEANAALLQSSRR